MMGQYPILDSASFWLNVISWTVQGGMIVYFVGGKGYQWYRDYKRSVEEEMFYQKEVE